MRIQVIVFMNILIRSTERTLIQFDMLVFLYTAATSNALIRLYIAQSKPIKNREQYQTEISFRVL